MANMGDSPLEIKRIDQRRAITNRSAVTSLLLTLQSCLSWQIHLCQSQPKLSFQ